MQGACVPSWLLPGAAQQGLRLSSRREHAGCVCALMAAPRGCTAGAPPEQPPCPWPSSGRSQVILDVPSRADKPIGTAPKPPRHTCDLHLTQVRRTCDLHLTQFHEGQEHRHNPAPRRVKRLGRRLGPFVGGGQVGGGLVGGGLQSGGGGQRGGCPGRDGAGKRGWRG